MQLTCKSFFVPNIKVSIDERMVASKARVGLKQYIQNKPTKWGYKLFVICDSKTGYTCDFNIYAGKTENQSDNGLTYDVVTRLMSPYLGQGYRLFLDNFYTSPILFRDLFQLWRTIFLQDPITTNKYTWSWTLVLSGLNARDELRCGGSLPPIEN